MKNKKKKAERVGGSRLAQLFFTFLKIGAFTFGGGYAMIPLVQRETVENHRWITDDELLDIFGIKVSGGDDESVKGAMAELHAKGAKNVLLTLGGDGAYFSNGEHIWFANRTFEVKLLSTVCAGDSSLAAFLSVWHDAPERVEDALRLSMATGANVVECPGLGDFAKVDEYKKHIEVRQVC